MVQSFSYGYDALRVFATDVLKKAGLPEDRAFAGATTLLEADLLGFPTHGMQRLSSNVKWLQTGQSRANGEPIVIADKAAIFNWDANFLPGIWLVRMAVKEAITRAKTYGVATATLRRCQHIASLAAYMPLILEEGMVGMMMVSSPSEKTVSGPTTPQPAISNNPIAFVAPAEPYPFLFDMSLASITNGGVTRAYQQGRKLPSATLQKVDGTFTDNPATFFEDPPSTIAPVGAPAQGYKGFVLSLMVEMLSSGLGNYGRGNLNDDEANVVFLQVFDPEAFGSKDALMEEVKTMRDALQKVDVKRTPGERSWQQRLDGLENGVQLSEDIVELLKPVAEEFGLVLPTGQLVKS
ncbi:MAG: Ldh family oxidoreductase [Pseudomonadota bacterium]